MDAKTVAIVGKTLVVVLPVIIGLFTLLQYYLEKRRDDKIGVVNERAAVLTERLAVLTERLEGANDENGRLERQLEEAKKNAPDVLAENLSKRVAMLKGELGDLATEKEEHLEQIEQKKQELKDVYGEIKELMEQMGAAEETLVDYEHYKRKFGCPTCGADMTTLQKRPDGEYVAYGCGFSDGPTPDLRRACPFDPNFPTWNDYAIETRYLAHDSSWFCTAKPKTKNGTMLRLSPQRGRTKPEAVQRMRKHYESLAQRVPSRSIPKKIA